MSLTMKMGRTPVSPIVTVTGGGYAPRLDGVLLNRRRGYRKVGSRESHAIVM